MHVSADHDADIPPGSATPVSPASAASSRSDGQGTSLRDPETLRPDMAAAASVAWPFTCPPVEPGAPSACDLLSGDERGGVSSACSGHGACVGSVRGSGVAGLGGGAVCVCEGDWFGDTCEHSAMHHSSFVPEIDPARSSARCMQAQGRQAAVAAWLQRLEADAKPATCGIDEAFVQEFSGTRGLGITWRWLSLALSTALQRGKTLVVGGRWPWFDFAGCHEGMRCYLEPLSNCTGAMVRDDMLARMLAQQSALKAGGDVSHLHPDTQDALRRRRWLPHGEAEIGRPEGQRVEGERPDGDSDGEAAELRRRAWVENLDLEGQVQLLLVGTPQTCCCCCSHPRMPGPCASHPRPLNILPNPHRNDSRDQTARARTCLICPHAHSREQAGAAGAGGGGRRVEARRRAVVECADAAPCLAAQRLASRPGATNRQAPCSPASYFHPDR